jgi:periplasmic divalent cation tolerance protein
MPVVIAHSSCPDAETAAHIAQRLVEESLAACVQTIPGVVSTYRWKGEVRSDTEVLLLIKTTRAQLAALEARLPQLHPYDVPELVVVDVVGGLDGYLDWVESAARSP